MGIVSDGKSHNHHPPIAQGKTVAEPQETQQEKDPMGSPARHTRYATKGLSGGEGTNKGENWLVVGAIVIIAAVIVAAILL